MDKFTATWVSHSSIADYLECPRSYFLKNVYKDPKTGHKMKLMTPALALGGAVHETLESLAQRAREERFGKPLIPQFEAIWEKYAGRKGGFFDDATENKSKEQGRAMLRRVEEHPGPLANLAIKIAKDLPNYWLSEEENIILCGKVDWLEYLEESKSIHIIDFKTGKNHEKEESLQLPIYLLLVSHTQAYPVTRASYWYLSSDDVPTEQALPDPVDAEKRVLDIARKIKLARQLKKFDCPTAGCRCCTPLERLLAGEGEYVGSDQYNTDVYVLQSQQVEGTQSQSIIH